MPTDLAATCRVRNSLVSGEADGMLLGGSTGQSLVGQGYRLKRLEVDKAEDELEGSGR